MLVRHAIFLAAVAGVLLSALYLVEGLRYSWGTASQPGPGLFPLVVGVLLLLGSLGTGVEAVLRRDRDEFAWPRGAALTRMVAILLATLGYVVLLPYLGHPFAATLVSLVILQVMGLRRWPMKIGLAPALGLGSHFLFDAFLGVPLPMGIWFS